MPRPNLPVNTGVFVHGLPRFQSRKSERQEAPQIAFVPGRAQNPAEVRQDYLSAQKAEDARLSQSEARLGLPNVTYTDGNHPAEPNFFELYSKHLSEILIQKPIQEAGAFLAQAMYNPQDKDVQRAQKAGGIPAAMAMSMLKAELNSNMNPLHGLRPNENVEALMNYIYERGPGGR